METKRMIINVIIICTAMASVSLGENEETDQASEGILTGKLLVHKDTYKVSEHRGYKIDLVLTNTGDKPISFVRKRANFSYELKGPEVKEFCHKRLTLKGWMPPKPETLEPGESATLNISCFSSNDDPNSTIYTHWAKPGKYTLKVTFEAIGHKAESQEVTLDVTE